MMIQILIENPLTRNLQVVMIQILIENPLTWNLQVVMIQILIENPLTLEPPGGDDTDIERLPPRLGASRW